MPGYLDSPMYREMLAKTLQGNSGPQYPLQAGANALAQIVQAYTLKSLGDQQQAQQQSGNQALADALLPGQDVPGMSAQAQIPATSEPAPQMPQGAAPGGIQARQINTPASSIDVSTRGFKAEDPNNAGLVAALNGGAISADSLAPSLMQKFGLGASKEPMKFSPGDVGFDPVTHQAIPGMSAPFKPDAPPKPEAEPEIVRTAKYLFPDDQKAQNDYIQKNSRASTVNINSGNQDAGWQMAMDPTNNNTPYRVNVRTGQAFGLDGQPYKPQGYGKVSTNNPRTAVAIYMDKWKQEHPKASADDVLTQMNMFTGQQAEHRTLGTQGAKVESANAGLDTVIDQSNTAYAKLPRGQFVPFNKLAEMAMSNAFSSPEQADAYAADAGVINLWGKSINPNGVLTVEAQKRGEQLLSQAQSPEAHAAVLQRMRAEGMASTGGIDHFRNPKGATAKPQPAAGAKAPTVSNW